jgi:nicotinamidase-related amidase
VARDVGLFVCYCATVFRPGYTEIRECNKVFRERKHAGSPPISDPVQLIHPAVQPIAGEVVVCKHRVNALYGTALDLIWRANTIDTLLALGYATSGVVLLTVRYAADLDYRLAVWRTAVLISSQALTTFSPSASSLARQEWSRPWT